MLNDLYTENLDVVQKRRLLFMESSELCELWMPVEMPWNRCVKIVVRFRQTFKDFKLSVGRFMSSDSFFLATQQSGAVFNFHVSRKIARTLSLINIHSNPPVSIHFVPKRRQKNV